MGCQSKQSLGKRRTAVHPHACTRNTLDVGTRPHSPYTQYKSEDWTPYGYRAKLSARESGTRLTQDHRNPSNPGAKTDSLDWKVPSVSRGKETFHKEGLLLEQNAQEFTLLLVS